MGKEFCPKNAKKGHFWGGKNDPVFSCFRTEKSKREFMPIISEEMGINSEVILISSEEISVIGEEIPQTSEELPINGEEMGINGGEIPRMNNAELRGPAWF